MGDCKGVIGNSTQFVSSTGVFMGLQPTEKGMKIGLSKAGLAITPTFVISTGAKRSGEICGFPHLAQRARQIWGTLD